MLSVSPRLCALLLAAGIVSVFGTPAAAQDRRSKLDRVLRDVVESGATGPQRVILQTRPGTRDALKRTLSAHGDVVEAEHASLDALTVTVHAADLAALDANPSVVAISVDARVTAFGKGVTLAAKKGGAHDGAAAGVNTLRASLGLDGTLFHGSGVNVAIVDSGIAPTRDLTPRIAGFWDFTRAGIRTQPYDDYGHGTHVAGLIASTGLESSNEYAGVAPAVHLYGLKVLDKSGRGRASDVVRALEWITANKRSTAPGAVKIDIVNLSLGHPVYEPAATDPLVRAVENAVRAGVIVVTAAGNHGRDEDDTAAYAGVTSPGNAPSAITVGAADTKNTAVRHDDAIAPFSSRGPTWFDGFAKPEIVAPGVGLTSEAAEGSELYYAYPELRLTGRYRKFARMSGTSMAAAVATGVASLALEASRVMNDRGLTPNALKALLQYTAVAVAGAEPLAEGAGQVNGRGAIALALSINTDMPVGRSWLRAHPRPVSLIGGELVDWSRAIVWNDTVIRGSDVLSINSQLWGDDIVWGTGCDTDAGDCVASVWGAVADADNIVWGTSLAWAADLAGDNRVVGLFIDGDNIVWGTLAGLTEDNIVWGTWLDGDNIVWGTRLDGDNIVWGTLRGDNIVWGTLIVGDNIVWGTVDGLGGRQ